uniref:SRCR domain-containing protein n=1 Tax=Periophthalmus magnuspinnatus TaxID=409849 RepID=A0A3B4A458_9GOBI
ITPDRLWAVLVGSGSSRCSGRVEIYHSRTWGTVCDDGWDMSEAKVVCRQVGCGVAIRATQNAHFGQGSGQIWLDEVSCSGSESSLTQCGHGGFGSHNCEHSEDAGVICSETLGKTQDTLEGLCLSAGLGTLGSSCLNCCPLNLPLGKRKKMDGWTNVTFLIEGLILARLWSDLW